MKKIYTTLTVTLIMALAMNVQGSHPFAGGEGTALNPYKIENAQQLDAIRGEYLSAHFIQTDSISLEDYGNWQPIGGRDNNGQNNPRFTGHYDGGNHIISHLTIYEPSRNNIGLFGHIGLNESGATTIRNVHLVNVNVIGGRGTGSLVGRVTGNQNTVIENCSATDGIVRGDGATGGLVGSNNSFMTNSAAAETFRPIISKSYAGVDVSLRSEFSEGKDKFGGLAGCNQKGFIANSYATGNVDAPAGYRIGGLTGCVELRGITVNSYAVGMVNGEVATNKGALVGYVGQNNNEGTVVGCYWLESVDGAQTSAGGEKLNDTQMKDQVSFEDWDFEGIWMMSTDTDYQYPVLRDMAEEPDVWVWTNAEDTDWNNPRNWDKGTLPNTTCRIEIKIDSDNHLPVLLTNIIVNEIYFHDGAGLTIEAGASLSVTGNLERDLASETLAEITGEGQLIMQGFTTQEIPSFVFDNLSINNFNNAVLAGDIFVKNQLKMENGFLDLNGKVFYLDSGATLLEWETSNSSSRVFGDNDGYIEIILDLDNPTGNIAGLGLEIISNQNLGTTTIKRGHREINGTDDSRSILRYFDIEPTNNTGLEASLVFHYFRGELNLVDEEHNFSLFKKNHDETDWIWIESTVNNLEQTITANNIDGFSTWTAGSSTSSHLPIELLSFRGELQNQNVLLQWVTASEINNDFFTIERSNDGINFSPVAYMQGAGNSNHNLYYTATDFEPLSGISYYRLKQTDFDGSFEYSELISVNNTVGSAADVVLYPNPNNGNFRLHSGSDTDIAFRVFDMQGRVVYASVLSPMAVNSYNIPELTAGIYTVVFYGRDVKSTKMQVR